MQLGWKLCKQTTTSRQLPLTLKVQKNATRICCCLHIGIWKTEVIFEDSSVQLAKGNSAACQDPFSKAAQEVCTDIIALCQV
jgi:hypothetical protein